MSAPSAPGVSSGMKSAIRIKGALASREPREQEAAAGDPRAANEIHLVGPEEMGHSRDADEHGRAEHGEKGDFQKRMTENRPARRERRAHHGGHEDHARREPPRKPDAVESTRNEVADQHRSEPRGS